MRIRTPLQFLPEHDSHIVLSSVRALALIAVLSSVGFLVVFAEPFTSLLALLTTLSVAVGTVALCECNVEKTLKLSIKHSAALWHVGINALTTTATLCDLSYTIVAAALYCHMYANAGSVNESGRSRVQYASQVIVCARTRPQMPNCSAVV